MMITAMLLMAILGPTPQDAPAPAPKRAHKAARTAKAATPAVATPEAGTAFYKIAEPKKHDSPGKKEAAAEFAKAYELDPNFQPVWGSHRG